MSRQERLSPLHKPFSRTGVPFLHAVLEEEIGLPPADPDGIAVAPAAGLFRAGGADVQHAVDGIHRPVLPAQGPGQHSSPGGEIHLHVILDRFSIEVFINDGEQVMTATILTDPSARGISFEADGKAVMDITKYSLFSEE